MSEAAQTVTPMMAQYLQIKADHADALLFYRMGDFYEMFFDDAVSAAAALDIALTKRGKHGGEDIPMCGVPAHAAEGYFLTLIRKGFRVAVCEQMENPAEAKKRGSKSVVRREVVRLVTPGTLTEDTLLEARRANLLAAWAEVRGTAALAWCDVSTGEIWVSPCPQVRLGADLARLRPQELLVSDASFSELADLAEDHGVALTPLARSSFDSTGAAGRLQDLYGVSSLDAFGTFERADVAALGAIAEYLLLTQKGKHPRLLPPQRETAGSAVQIDAATRANLELTRSLSGGSDGSLIAAIDRTVTAAGARLLDRRLSGPSRNLAVIRDRHDAIATWVDETAKATALRTALRQVSDLDRALSRLALDRGGPRDLAAVRATTRVAQDLSSSLASAELPRALSDARHDLCGHGELQSLLETALVAEPPMLARDGGFVAPAYDGELDEARQLRDEGRSVIAVMQGDYATEAGVASLKIKHNNVLGYFIETTATHAQRMLAPPLNERFIHRQTTANAVRFTTLELAQLETKILNAGGRALEIERRIFATLSEAVLRQSQALGRLSAALAEFDVSTALADLAIGENWCRPQVDESRAFDIKAGRHPVVERALRRQSGAAFVANDCDLSAAGGAAIRLLTGPNMAGKSTWLRQNALIALLAQSGCYVPATSARIGLVSQIFSRVGASDDLARGRSTFMVEMVETAAILNQADGDALVILDEIGRGTATYDGLSIAWATLEHLHDVNGCRALFATHYHEMTALADRMAGVENATVAVREWEGDVIFLHEVRKGAADRSYGVQVARLAGLPEAVVNRARDVLNALEAGEREGAAKPKALIDDLPLFAVTPAPAAKSAAPSAVEDRLAEVLPDELTPRTALDLIYELKALTKN